VLSNCSVDIRVLFRLPTGQEKLEKVGIEWSRKVRERSGENIFPEKSGKIKTWCHQMSDLQAKMHQI